MVSIYKFLKTYRMEKNKYKMKTLNTITLSGADNSKIQIIETKLLELLSALKLPITINLTQESFSLSFLFTVIKQKSYFDQNQSRISIYMINIKLFT